MISAYLIWYQSKDHKLKPCLYHLPLISIKIVYVLSDPTREGEYYSIN